MPARLRSQRSLAVPSRSSTEAVKSKRLADADSQLSINYQPLMSCKCAVHALGPKGSRPSDSNASFEGYSDLANDVGEAGHVRAKLYLPGLGADLAQADRFFAQFVPARAALHAGPRSEMAREAPAIAPGC
jgi:hypothetical protein